MEIFCKRTNEILKLEIMVRDQVKANLYKISRNLNGSVPAVPMDNRSEYISLTSEIICVVSPYNKI